MLKFYWLLIMEAVLRVSIDLFDTICNYDNCLHFTDNANTPTIQTVAEHITEQNEEELRANPDYLEISDSGSLRIIEIFTLFFFSRSFTSGNHHHRT